MNWRRCLLCAFNEAREDRFNAKSTSSFLFLRCFLFLLSPLARLVQYTCISLSCYFWDHSTNNFRYFSKYYCSINTSTINGYKYLCSHIVCPNEQACQCEVISFFWCSPLYIPCSLQNGNFLSHDDIRLKRLSNNKHMYAIDTLSVRRDTTTMHDFEMDPRWQSVPM